MYMKFSFLYDFLTKRGQLCHWYPAIYILSSSVDSDPQWGLLSGWKLSHDHHTFFKKNPISMNNKLTDALWWSLIIKSTFPLKALLVSAYTEFASVYTFQNIMKLESFAQGISTLNVSEFSQHVFTDRKYEVRITEGTTTHSPQPPDLPPGQVL